MQLEVVSGCKCAALRYLVDASRDIDVPVGVALWDTERRSLHFRLPREGDRIEDVPMPAANTYLLVAKAQIEGWKQGGRLPYAQESLEPLSDAWWEQVRRLMQFSVRVGPVQPVDCREPEADIETLYDALVQPQTSARTRRSRIDGSVTKALGKLASRFQRGLKVQGFGARPVRVQRAAADERRVVIVEAVNLAGRTAEQDADALTSRLERVREGERSREVRLILGYLASPGGLNGEAALKEWIEHRLDARAFDLQREPDAFQDAACREVAPVGAGSEHLVPAA